MIDELFPVFLVSPLCRSLNEDEVAVLSRYFTTRRFEALSVIYSEGDAAAGFYLVASGQVDLSRRAVDGTSKPFARLRNGEMFGEDSLFAEGERDHSAVCRDECTVLKLAREDYRRILDEQPRLAGKLLSVLSDRLKRAPSEQTAASTPSENLDHRVGAFFSAKGGVGCSFLASNFAALAAQAGHSVCLVELDLQFGNLDAFVSVKPPRHPWTLDLRTVPSKLLDQFAARPLENLRVYMRPRDVVEGERITPAQVTLLINHCRAISDLVVLDCRAGFNEQVLAALDMSDRVFVVTTADFAGIVATRSLIAVLSQLGYRSTKVGIIHNRASSSRDYAVADRAKLFDGITWAVLPEEPKVYDAVNRSRLFAVASPSHAICDELRKILTRVMGAHHEQDGGTVGFVAKWLGWFSSPGTPAATGSGNDSTHPFSGPSTKNDPRFALAELALGQSNFLVGKYDVAARAFERAVRRDPTCAAAYFYMAEIAAFDESPEAARALLDNALRCAPGSLRYKARLALVSKSAGEVQAEVTALEEVRAAHPEYADIRCLLARLYALRGDHTGALAEVDAALAVNPRYVEAATFRGALLRKEGHFLKALTQLLEVLATSPSHVPALHELGMLLGDLDLWTLARVAHTRALSIYPAHPPSHRRLVDVHDGIKVARREVEAYGEATRNHPGFGDMFFKLGVAYYQVYQFERSKLALRRAEECGYEPERVRDVRALLERVGPLLEGTFLASGAEREDGEQDLQPSVDELPPLDAPLAPDTAASV